MQWKKNKNYLVILSIVLVLMLLFAGCSTKENGGQNNEEDVYEVNYQLSHQPMQYITQHTHIPFAERLEERSDGRLKVLIFDTRSVTDDTIEAASEGLLEIAGGGHNLYPGVFPLTETFRLPFLLPGATIASIVSWHIYENFPEWRAEYPENVVVLGQFTSPTHQLHSKTPIRTLEDLQGKRIGAWDSMGLRIVEALGGIPIRDTGPDSAMNLDRGLIDAVLCPLAPVKAYGIDEIARYHTIGDFYTSTFFYIANRQWLESLPEDLQDIIVSNFGYEFAEQSGLAMDEGALMDCEDMVEKVPGTEFIVLSPDELDRWREKMEPVYDEYLEKMDETGKREVAEAIIAEIKSYRQQLIEEGKFIPDYASLN
ncbi:MAG TPA: TRAP transporter substrate-binding protein DctP [Firmicutes bacterium]|nr:TRAP transporter substrate-binding protein DctP [Bacillota bacterium]